MTIVASYIYRDGRRAEELPLTETPFVPEASEFAWIGLVEPTAEEMASLKAMLSRVYGTSCPTLVMPKRH